MQNLARAFETNRLLVLDDGTGPTAFVYDATGNTTNDGTRTFAYDARNRMTTADGHSYAYNALAQRVYKSAGIPATDPAALIAQLEAEITEIEANIALWTSQAQQATIAGLAAEASAQAAHAQADALIAEAAAHREAQHQAAAAAWTAQAASYRATATDLRSGIQPGGGLIQRIVNAILNALASVADALANIADDRAEARGQDAQQAALAALAAEAEAANQTAIAANTSAQAQAALADAVALQAQIAAAQESMQGLEQQIAELMTNPPVGGALVFTYDASGRLIGEYTTDGTPVRRYLWLEDLPLALIDQTGIHFIHSDHLNTPQAVTDSNGTLVWAADYTPFGEVTETVTTVEVNLRFPGQYHDRETGLHQNWHREYDPMTGRYTQSDPIGLMGGLNVYAYALSNPLRMFDHDGLRPYEFQIRVGGGIGHVVIGGSVYTAAIRDVTTGESCTYQIRCIGAGVGLPESGVTSKPVRFDDGNSCSTCSSFEGLGYIGGASAQAGGGVSLGGGIKIPNGPFISGDYIEFDYGGVKIGVSHNACYFRRR